MVLAIDIDILRRKRNVADEVIVDEQESFNVLGGIYWLNSIYNNNLFQHMIITFLPHPPFEKRIQKFDVLHFFFLSPLLYLYPTSHLSLFPKRE